MRLIDADELIGILDHQADELANFKNRTLTHETLRTVIGIIKFHMPTVEAIIPEIASVERLLSEPIPDVIWVEHRRKGFVAGIWMSGFYAMQDDSILEPLNEVLAEYPEIYNITWRVWTACPTEKQREETPWGDEDDD